MHVAVWVLLELKNKCFWQSEERWYIIYVYITKKCQKLTVCRCFAISLAHAKMPKCLNAQMYLYVWANSHTHYWVCLRAYLHICIYACVYGSLSAFFAFNGSLICMMYWLRVHVCVRVCRNFSKYRF